MEELIELLIRLIAGLMKAGQVPQAPARRPTAAAPMASKPPGVRAKPPGIRRAGARRLTPPPIAVARPIVTGTGSYSPATVAAQVAPAKTAKPAAAPAVKPSATAATLRRWMTPETLRQQFILTEILQPPLALRETPRIQK
jgi:hypothetical protein